MKRKQKFEQQRQNAREGIDKMPIDCPYVLEHAVSERQPQC